MEHLASGPKGFRKDVEGLRAIAVVMVIVYHLGFSWATGGFAGVDVFFVISGFLITGLLVKEVERTGTISLIGFYARRAKRLFPAAATVLPRLGSESLRSDLKMFVSGAKYVESASILYFADVIPNRWVANT